MALTPAEAQSALKDIEQTGNRAAAAEHGRLASPYLIMWGAIWMIGYVVTDLAPEFSWIWLGLVVVGIVGSFLLGARERRPDTQGFGWRYGLSFAVLAVFIAALFTIVRPTDGNQMGAIFPLAIGLYYAFIGIWTKGGWRMLPLGVALIALTAGGYFFLPSHFMLWMAGVGGGGLILGGLWLRSV